MEPVIVRITPEAKAAWKSFFNSHAEEQVQLTGDLSAAWSKLEGYAARLALVVHFVRVAAGDPTLRTVDAVDEASIAAGVALSRWFGHEARRVYGMLAESDDDRERRRLVEWISQPGKRRPDGTLEREAGTATPRYLMRSSRQYPTADDAERALNDLMGAGFGRWEWVHTGCRPSKRFRLADAVDVDRTTSGDGVAAGIVNVNAVNESDDEWGEL